MTSNHSNTNLSNPTPLLTTEKDSQDLNPSSSVFNSQEDFTFLEQIGSGGFGSVYKVESKTPASVFAVKVIQKARTDEEDYQEQKEFIENEISISLSLLHPHILASLGNWQDSQTVKIISHFEPGGNLRQLIKRSIITENQAKQYILDLGSALDYIHKKNIIHRDVKLENILLTEDGKIKLADFGLAVRAPEGLAYGDYGTRQNRAPEVITEASYTSAVDWWALGVILYQMIVREDPFKPSDGKTLEDNIIETRPTIPSTISYECYFLIGRLLQKKPKFRLSSFEALISQKFFKDM